MAGAIGEPAQPGQPEQAPSAPSQPPERPLPTDRLPELEGGALGGVAGASPRAGRRTYGPTHTTTTARRAGPSAALLGTYSNTAYCRSN